MSAGRCVSTVRDARAPRSARVRPALRSCRARAFRAFRCAAANRAAADGSRTGTGSGRVQSPDTGIHPRAGLRALAPQPGSPGTGLPASSPGVASTQTTRRRTPGSDAASLRVRGRAPLVAAPHRAATAGTARFPSGHPRGLRAARITGVRRAHPRYHWVRERPRGPLRCLPGVRS